MLFRSDLPEMSVGAFEEIKEQPTSKSYPQQKLIRSHLPVRHAVKMGAGSLKTKPVRLVFTILLSVIAFILFGLASTLMLFDGKSVTKESLDNSGDEYVILSKAYYETQKQYNGDKLEYESEYKQITQFTFAEYEKIRERFPEALAVLNFDSGISMDMPSNVSQFYTSSIESMVISAPSVVYVSGSAPTALDEIAISDFMLMGMQAEKVEVDLYRDEQNSESKDITSAENIIYSQSNPVKIRIGDSLYKVTGVYKGSQVPSDYSAMKDAADKCLQYTGDDYMLQWQWGTTRRNGLYAAVAVTREFAEKYAESNMSNTGISLEKYFDYNSGYVGLGFDEAGEFITQYDMYMLAKYEERNGTPPLKLYDGLGNAVASLSENGIALNCNGWARIMVANIRDAIFTEEFTPAQEKYYELQRTISEKAEEDFRKLYPEPDQNENWEEWGDWNIRRNDYVDQAWRENDPIGLLSSIAYEDIKGMDVKKTIKQATEFARSIGIEKPNCQIRSDANGNIDNIVVDGIYFEGNTMYTAYMSDSLYENYFVSRVQDNWHNETSTKYVAPKDAFIARVLVGNTSDAVDYLVDATYERAEDDSSCKIQNSLMDQLDYLIELADTLELGFLVAGLVLALFAFLLMFNFISVSISAKKKEIGILRAIGARTLDVFKIFLSEALIIAVICFAISTLGTFGLCAVLNTMLVGETFIKVSLFVFGPLSVLLILGIAIVTAAVSTVIPVALYSRKPPIASIRAL